MSLGFGRCIAVALVGATAVALLPSCSQTANITEVYTALDGDGNRRRNEFFTDTKEIHCVAEAGIGRPGVTIEGFIRQLQAYDFATNKFVPVDRVLAYTEFSPGQSDKPVKIDLSLTPGQGEKEGESANDQPFIAGRYQCEVRLDGSVEGIAVFNIDFPPCPPAVIIPGTRCFGYYRENDLCPAAGESGQQDPKCSCSLLEGWKC